MMFYTRRLGQTQDNLKSGRTKIVNVYNHNEEERVKLMLKTPIMTSESHTNKHKMKKEKKIQKKNSRNNQILV